MLSLALCAAFFGVVAHQCIFRRFDLDAHPFLIGGTCAGAHIALVRGLQIFSSYSHAWSVALIFSLSFLTALFTSILVYREFFHPLKNFDGPPRARLSKFWTVGLVLHSRMRWYQVLDELHQSYGDYVRTGPRELSISDPAAIGPVLGLSSKTTKGPFYGSMQETIHTTRDKSFHRFRRRIWDTAFKEALSAYGPRIEEFTHSFLSRIGRNAGKPININEICVHFSYDVMSALAFGQSAGFTDEKSSDVAKKVLGGIHAGMDAIAILIHVPWILKMLEACSGIPSPMKVYNDWSAQQVEMRRQMKDPQPDIMGHLMKYTPNDAAGKTLLDAESRVIIGAGSDTTAIALTLSFIYLALHPTYTSLIRAETLSARATNPSHSPLRPLPLLDAFIHEILRLHPPVTFAAQRVTPPTGLVINNTPIPGNTVVSIPTHRLHRDARNFAYPNAFIPERWTSRTEMVLNKAAFLPFSTGAFNCAGKGLAMMELRAVVAGVAAEFDVGFPVGEGFKAEAFFARMTDHFTLGVPACDLVFTRTC